MVNLWQIADTLGPERSSRLNFTGHGGEIARCHFTPAQHFLPKSTDRALRQFVTERAGDRAGLLTHEGAKSVHETVLAFSKRMLELGYRRDDLGDAFYSFERMPHWLGANGRKAPGTAVFAPLATRPFMEAAWSLPAIARYSEPLHFQLLRYLAPDLHRFPHKGGWRSQAPYVNLLGRAIRRVRTRTSRLGHPAATPIQVTWLDALGPNLASMCLDQSASPLWAVIDRRKFEELALSSSAVERRRRAAETIFSVVTVFAYERLRRAG